MSLSDRLRGHADWARPYAVWLWRFARREAGLVLALAIVAGGLWVFVNVVDEAMEGDAHAVDRAILLALRTPGDPAQPIGPPWLTVFVKDLTALGSFSILAVVSLLVAGYLALSRDWGRIALIAVSVLGGMALSQWGKSLFDRPRPDFVAHLVEVQTASLPSAHAMMAAVVYLTLGVLLAQVQERRRATAYVLGAAVALTVAVGASRVFLGVHYPSDVLAGWAFGAAWAMACWAVARAFALYRRQRAGGPAPASGR